MSSLVDASYCNQSASPSPLESTATAGCVESAPAGERIVVGLNAGAASAEPCHGVKFPPPAKAGQTPAKTAREPSTFTEVIDQDHRLGSVRDRLLERYLGFAFGGLHFELRDISAEIAEARRMMAEFLGRELRLPDRPSRLIHLWIVTDESGEIVGNAAREVGLRGSALVVAHKELRIRRPEWRRRGFGSALLAENRVWYRECGVAFIVMEAEGDGSAFAAVRGFDFDVTSYAHRPAFKGLTEQELRFAAVDRLIHHPAIQDTVDGADAPLRESAAAFLERIKASGAESARQVERFQQHLPNFTAPEQIAAFGQHEPLEALNGRSLGAAVLALTGWSGIDAL
jgi:GNAT superfamily N-acetyltransferase